MRQVESLEGRVLLSNNLGDEKHGPLSRIAALAHVMREYDEFQADRAAGKARGAFKSKDPTLRTAGESVYIETYTLGGPKQLEAKLKKLGATDVFRYVGGASALLPLDKIDDLALLPELNFARPVGFVTSAGGTMSQGDAAQRADVARNIYGLTGSGVKVGALSDSFNRLGGYATDIGTGDLPAGVTVIQDSASGTDEGRAMLQLIYDSAPSAQLSFATAFAGQASFANNIKALRDNGAKVITDDVIYFDEPMFQDGLIAQAIDNVVATNVSYFSSANNQGRQAYESVFRTGVSRAGGSIPTTSGPTFFGGVTHDFDPGAGVDDMQSFTLANGQSITLSYQWNQPYGSLNGATGPSNEMDLYILNAAGSAVVGGLAALNQGLGRDPIERFTFTNSTGASASFNLMIVLFAGAAPTFMKYVNFGVQNFTEFNTNSGALYGHTNSAGTASVAAAAFFSTPAFGVSPGTLESFSSRGSTPIYFNAVGTPLGSPVTRQRPLITAPDGGNTSFFGSDSTADFDTKPNFFGTSAAAPQAAAVAALMYQLIPSITPTQVYNALTSTSLDLDNPDTGGFDAGYDFATGFGLIRADKAIAALANANISGQVFKDHNSDGSINGLDAGINGVTTYLDTDNDNVLDSGTTSPASVDVPKSISDLATVTSNLIVAGLAGVITDINVTLNITHTWDEDVDAFLVSPLGQRVELFTDVGGSGDNFVTTLDDEAGTSIAVGTPPFTGSFKPEGLLSELDGFSANGTWTLELSDDVSMDTGTLNSWSLAISTAEKSVVTSGSGNFTYSSVLPVTHNIRQQVPAGFIQTSPSGGAARVVAAGVGATVTGQNLGDFPISYAGSGSGDTYVLSRTGGTTIQIVETLGVAAPVAFTVPAAALGSATLTFNTGAGDDTLTINHSGGNPVGAGGVTYNGGTNLGGGDSFAALGTSGIDTATFNNITVVMNGGTSSVTAVENFSYDGLGGFDTVTVNGGTVTFPATQQFQNLTIGTGATARLAAGGSRVINTRGLSITGTGRLDMNDNDLIIDYTGASVLGTWDGLAYTGVTGLLQSGYAGGPWTGPGINSSFAADTAINNNNLTAMVPGESAAVLGITGAQTATWNGQTVDATAVLVKYSYTGDADVNGELNGDDYFYLDSNILQNGTVFGYHVGDFDYNGELNGDDYFWLDANILFAQGEGPL